MRMIALLLTLPGLAIASSFERDAAVIEKQPGCYLVDYNFTEVESLKPGYATDERVYDTNTDKTTFEWIEPIRKSPIEIRLQHVLMLKDLVSGCPTLIMKHQAEDWAYEPGFYFDFFDFVTTGFWKALKLAEPQGKWVRKVTNLDDGLSYQCAAAWDHSKANPEWKCDNFAPIRGRETRDISRLDYQALARSTRLVSYGRSWLERQDNVKTILDGDRRVPSARELGRAWYIAQDASACAEAREFVAQRRVYRKLLLNERDEILGEKADFREHGLLQGRPRYSRLLQIEERYFDKVEGDPAARASARDAIRAVIRQYRRNRPRNPDRRAQARL